jgi:hypothetical protein
LYLTSIKYAVALAKGRQKDTANYETSEYGWMKKEYPDIKFVITRCDDGQTVFVGFAANQLWYTIRDITGHNIVEKMKVDGSWEFLLR